MENRQSQGSTKPKTHSAFGLTGLLSAIAFAIITAGGCSGAAQSQQSPTPVVVYIQPTQPTEAQQRNDDLRTTATVATAGVGIAWLLLAL
jgi:hypothetical protein